jgi:hypothetical protein
LYGVASLLTGAKKEKSAGCILALSDKEIERVIKASAVTKRAQELTQVPWEVIAAIWYRESFSMAPQKTPGGPFQFDPVPTPQVLKNLLRRFTTLADHEGEHFIRKGVDDFEAGAVFAACWLRRKSKKAKSF